MEKRNRLFFCITVLEVIIIAWCIIRISLKEEKLSVLEPENQETAVMSGEGLLEENEPESSEEILCENSHTDFGEVDAGVISKDPAVRIRLTTSDYTSEYHESVVLTCNQTFQLQTGDKAQIFTGGQTVLIRSDHPFFQEGNIRVSSEGEVLQIDSILHRGQVNTYPGVLDLYLTDKGIVIVNELSLEEYVERVVPSEMPAAYGTEAAKLQAVCARTYAYQKLTSGQTDTYGTIANDSTEYQVYNASLPKEVSSRAAEETRGIVLMYDGSPLIPYYFSTSCGFNTDNTVWGGQLLAYLRAQNLSYGGELELQSEEVFRNFILNWDYPAYEDDCTWYRWNYTISLEGLKGVLTKRIAELAAQRPEAFRAVMAGGAETAIDTAHIQNLQEIRVTKRLKGGMAGEIALICGGYSIYVTKEMIIRKLLGCPERVYSNLSSNGSSESEGNYLPSAFFCLVEHVDEYGNKSYSICGGGNGHGIGLSQNAANAMLQAGLTWGEVLQFFYLGTSLVQVY